MSVVYVVYHDCNYEERSMELLNVCRLLGKVHLVSYAKPIGICDIEYYHFDRAHFFARFNLLFKAANVIKQVKPDICVLHDSDCSLLIKYIKLVSPKTKIVYDSSELDIHTPGEPSYIRKKRDDTWLIWLKRIFAYYCRYGEKKYLKLADVVMAANIERAQIMKDYFKLAETPIVFDNMHKINVKYDSAYCDRKYGNVFDKKTFNILFGGGITEDRDTYKFIEAVSCIQIPCNLIIVGMATPQSVERCRALVEKLGIADRVKYMGMLPRSEFRYFLKHSDASVVIFDQYTYNSIYCASGKTYESLFEGTPILTSENPPLKRLCEQYGVGVSNDDYAVGIKQLVENYDNIRKNVQAYITSLRYEQRVEDLADVLRLKLGL